MIRWFGRPSLDWKFWYDVDADELVLFDDTMYHSDVLEKLDWASREDADPVGGAGLGTRVTVVYGKANVRDDIQKLIDEKGIPDLP